MLLKSVFVLLLCVTAAVKCARILGIFDCTSRSHHILGSALLKALANRGHQVTMISPFPLKTPLKNYEDIELVGLLEYSDKYVSSNITKSVESGSNVFMQLPKMTSHMQTIFEMAINQSVHHLLKSNRKYDLIIQDWFVNEANLGIAHHFKAPVIAFSTSGSSPVTNKLSGNTNPFSYVPNVFFGFLDEMTFLQRVQNTVGSIVMDQIFGFLTNDFQQQMFKKHFPNAPPLHELEKNVSLVLLNSHFSTESPRPHVPSLIQIGGFHVDKPKELTGELKTYMDSAKEGVLYFSLGSNVKSASLSQKTLKSIVSTFAKLPVKVLWKFEADDLPSLPSNVKVLKWLPQADILAHPNLRAFVSHGGLLSTTEAIYRGVPLVGIPLFADQRFNIAGAVNKGFAVKVDISELNEETLTEAINEVLNNSKYRENIQQISRLLRDQPMDPMDTAVFWVEYVIRHKGAHHLKTAALKLQWYQYFLLDVVAFILGIVFLVALGCYFVIVKFLKVLRRAFKKSSIKSAKKKSKKA